MLSRQVDPPRPHLRAKIVFAGVVTDYGFYEQAVFQLVPDFPNSGALTSGKISHQIIPNYDTANKHTYSYTPLSVPQATFPLPALTQEIGKWRAATNVAEPWEYGELLVIVRLSLGMLPTSTSCALSLVIEN